MELGIIKIGYYFSSNDEAIASSELKVKFTHANIFLRKYANYKQYIV